MILVVTDPPDPLAELPARVPGMIACYANQVEAQVIGELGVSQVFFWSAVRIAGVPIGKLIKARG